MFQPTRLEECQDVSLRLYELLPFVIWCISIHLEQPLTFYEKETLYVSILIDDTFDVYEIQWNDYIFPFSLSNSAQ